MAAGHRQEGCWLQNPASCFISVIGHTICEGWLLKMVAEEVGYFEVQLAGSDPDSESFVPRLTRELLSIEKCFQI